MAYVYRHIRLDKNEPFYIGIGNSDINSFKRAYIKHSRSEHWSRIANKYGYEVDILLSDISSDFAKIKEIEFIKLYGRSDLGEGSLINMTDGGEGCVNLSKETREKISKTQKGKVISEECREKLRKAITGVKHPEWRNKIKSISQGGINHWQFGKKANAEVLMKKSKSMKEKYRSGFVSPRIGHKDTQVQLLNKRERNFVPVVQYTKNGEFVKEWDSPIVAKEMLGINSSCIARSCKTHLNAGGFKWEYKKCV